MDTGCTGTCVVDVDGFIPRTELRLGDDGGKELDCEGGTAVDIVGGEVMDNDAIDDTKSATLDATLSDSVHSNVLLKLPGKWLVCVERSVPFPGAELVHDKLLGTVVDADEI